MDEVVVVVAGEEAAMTAWTAMTTGEEEVPAAGFTAEAAGSVELVVAVDVTLDEMTTVWEIVAEEVAEVAEGLKRNTMIPDVVMIVSTVAETG